MNMKKSGLIGLIGILAAVPGSIFGVDAAIEVGSVKWARDLDSALVESGKSGKPVLLLFQEVPG